MPGRQANQTQMVEADSACLEIATNEGLDANHAEMNKFRDPSSPGYVGVRTEIQTMIRSALNLGNSTSTNPTTGQPATPRVPGSSPVSLEAPNPLPVTGNETATVLFDFFSSRPNSVSFPAGSVVKVASKDQSVSALGGSQNGCLKNRQEYNMTNDSLNRLQLQPFESSSDAMSRNASGKMPTLTSLPFDVQRHIISYLHSVRDYAALSIQCRALHQLCDMETRRRYHKIQILPNTSSLDTAFGQLMEILRRPHLGHYVRQLEVCTREPQHLEYAKQEPQREINDEDKKLLEKAVQNAGFADSDSLIFNMLQQRMAYGDRPFSLMWNDPREDADKVFIPQALAAVLVSVSPYLESLAVTPMGVHYWQPEAPRILYPLDHLLRSVNDNPEKDVPYLQHLREVEIINAPQSSLDDGRFYMRMELYTPILTICKLPSIRSVTTDLVDEYDVGEDLEPGSSNITHIAIHHSSMSSSYLAPIICMCKELHDFSYSVGGRSTNDGGYPLFNPKTIIRALLFHKQTLGNLDLDVESYIHQFTSSCDYAYILLDFDRPDYLEGEPEIPGLRAQSGSLRDFQALKRLSIGIGFLFYFAGGTDRDYNSDQNSYCKLISSLPPNLEYLCIRGYKQGEFPDRDPHIEELMRAVREGGLQLEVTGIDKIIPHAENVEDPDGEPRLLWKSRWDSDYEEDEDDDEEEDEEEKIESDSEQK
ncbi:hypothetical protein BJX63DRAFT_430185 [Aspergillus granulosus]|uniref:F-box domain-containing protein n=1 Tax=Aspergillus granulosus TaxID=176169 RepID=A0ABR4HLY4_9EURO